MPATASQEAYSSLMDEEDLSVIWLVYYILDDFELELPSLGAQANDSSPGCLGV